MQTSPATYTYKT